MMENPFFIDRGDEMKAENEVRVLDIDVDQFISLLKERGATYVDTYFQQRYVYDLKPKQTGKWLRLRTNGKETTLTIKHIESDNRNTYNIDYQYLGFKVCQSCSGKASI